MTHCRAFEDILPLHASHDTTIDEGLRVEEHLIACEACRADLALYERMCETARSELAQEQPASRRAPEGEPASRREEPTRGWLSLVAAALLVTAGASAGVVAGRWSTAPDLSPAVASAPSAHAAVPAAALPLSVFSPAARGPLSRLAQR